MQAGDRYGRWTILSKVPTAEKNSYWHCRCDCGNVGVISRPSLRSGRSRSCGCLRREVSTTAMSNLSRTHGASHTVEYQAWTSMISRCYRRKDASYASYGGRGIRVSQKWRKNFPAFLAHIGFRPSPHHSLDRIDTYCHYEPGNVRWATAKEQAANRRPRRT